MVIVNKLVTNRVPVMMAQSKTGISAEMQAAMKPEKIGYRLKLLRESQELKPAEMADLLGIERTYWSRFENGKRAISDTVAVLLVERFGVTLDFLILGRWDRLPLDLAVSMRSLDEKYTSSND